MITADAFLEPAQKRGVDFYCGVPCSFLTPLINGVIENPNLEYVTAASEGEAVAIAAGAWLAGRGTAMMCQNSGLGNAINPLTSLNYPFRIPTLLITTWRAGPGLKDEPQHELMGEITPDLFDLMRIPRLAFPTSASEVAVALDAAISSMEETRLPFAMIMQKDDVAENGPSAATLPSSHEAGAVYKFLGGEMPTRIASMEQLLSLLPDTAAVIATTGKCGRELFTINDRDQHFYQVGSMGCAAAMGLGVALSTPNPVVVLDGDGALLMKMGTLGTVGAFGPENLIHVVLDNGTYDSTGGQPTVSSGVDFAQAAVACGYASTFRCDSLDGLKQSTAHALAKAGPHLIHMRILPGSTPDLGRPTIKPADIAIRFQRFISDNRSLSW
ncbi:MAG: hypothetical protein CFH05_01744 [Alphaproteobacteria bacterium MarineAlpha3_Bin4]|nr:MAG: hypothetical protein CFH05_01744 [Alphaproteobacteria bacterium MarineAlpha3_Bin4]